jgi:hypothetical protein
MYITGKGRVLRYGGVIAILNRVCTAKDGERSESETPALFEGTAKPLKRADDREQEELLGTGRIGEELREGQVRCGHILGHTGACVKAPDVARCVRIKEIARG